MSAIQLHSAMLNGNQLAIIAHTNDDSFRVVNINIEVTNAATGSTASGRFGVAFDLPDVLIVDGKLLSWEKIQKKIEDARQQTAPHAPSVKDLETARDILRRTLANLSVTMTAEAGGFFGITGVGFGDAVASARLVIDLTLLDPDLADGPSDDLPMLTASLSAVGHCEFLGTQCDAACSIDVVVTRKGLISCLPALSLDPPQTVKFPPLDLRWPAFDWPSLDWTTIKLGELASLFRFDLPIPRIGNTPQSLHIVWSEPRPEATFQIVDGGKLEIRTTQPGNGSLVFDGGNGTTTTIAGLTDFAVSLSGERLALSGTITPEASAPIDIPARVIEGPDVMPFTIELEKGEINVQISAAIPLDQATTARITATLNLPRVIIRAKSDPSLLLALHVAYEQSYDPANGQSSGRLTALEIIEPYPIQLVAMAAHTIGDAAAALIRMVGALELNKPGISQTGLLAVINRLAAMAAAAAKWLAKKAAGIGNALLGIVEAIGRLLEEFVRFLGEKLRGLPGGNPHIAVELRLDSRNFALRQIIISPVIDDAPPLNYDALGFSIEIPFNLKPSLVIDLEGSPCLALVILQQREGAKITLETDLWLSRDAGVEAVRDTDEAGKRPANKLVRVTATLPAANVSAISILRLHGGKVSFFETMTATVTQLTGDGVNVASVEGRIVYDPPNWAQIEIKAAFAPDTPTRLLPFLQSPKELAGDNFLKSLNQYIEVHQGTPVYQGGKVTFPVDTTLHIGKTATNFNILLDLDLADFSIRLHGDEKVTVKAQGNKSDFNIFGLTGEITEKKPSGQTDIDLFTLDFSGGDVRLKLADTARLNLTYGKVASAGQGIVFSVDVFELSRSGLDLDARVDPDKPVQLAGVDMPFRFDTGGLVIKNSKIQAFSITGSGQLPPELVGEANATVTLMMGRDTDGGLIVQSAQGKLDKSNDPIVCHSTRFTLTLSSIGFELKNFSAEGAGYHFYFTLTGTAQFTPRAGEFTDGLLKNFGDLIITLDKVPLARDPSMLLRAIEFQVTVEPRKQINFFNLFSFELRGIGFHPKSPAFDGQPAMSISGQVNFVEAGDIISPRFDFHKLWIAPPPEGDWRPRVRFDGLTVGVRFGGSADIEGTAIAVDDQLPTLFKPGALPANVTTHGFLAAGKLTIKGWGQMAAAMGFLELTDKSTGEVRPAFFLYGQGGEISIEIPTPLGPVYLREVGFGFGYRYTLAAFNRTDQVKNVQELIKALDDISKYQGELASVTAWEPEAKGNRLTLALRGLLSITTASGTNEYNAEGERDLSNPLLFDIVVALRSDLTFFMNARGWIARNYTDWHDSSSTAAWRSNPTLRGYVYLSVPRKEFLARMIADGSGDVEGKHPQLPKPLIDAMKGIRWSATTYIRPGLFHQEYGWPYELGFTLGNGNTFQIVCQGGIVTRIEDQSILYGIAFRARGFAQIGGSVGGRSFGASVVARADFSIDAKLIAYLSLKRFSDTLFYGSIAFDVTISFQVRVWLDIDLGFTDIHLEVGFSLSLTVSVALEIALSPEKIGGRGTASVAVGAFGRTIRLGVGFGFNEDMLVTARSRVERFLALGLTVAIPDAEQGIAPPAPEQPRGPAAADADSALDESIEKHEKVSEPGVPGAPPQRPVGRPLQASGYWAMLFPVAGAAGADHDTKYVMIFVPRDHSATGLDRLTDFPKFTAGGEPLGSFYPPPRRPGGGADSELQIIYTGGGNVPVVDVLSADGNLITTPFGQQIALRYALDAVVALHKDKVVKVSTFLDQCFVQTLVGQDIRVPKEPLASPIKTNAIRLPDTREAAARMLSEAGRDQTVLSAEYSIARDIEERRSAAIAGLCEGASRLAADPGLWKSPATEGLDPRKLGIAFVVTEHALTELFDGLDGNTPPKARFNLVAADRTMITPLPDTQVSVHLFNPPERMFNRRGPRLAEPVVEATRSGIRLDWDLEPAFGASNGVWDDPEFNLKHYRIERRITGNQFYPPRRVTVKAAAPLRLERDPERNQYVWRYMRPNAQFVDDLSDLPPEVRAAILPGIDLAPDKTVQTVRYIVIPVDTAGTEGAPTPLQLDVVPQLRPPAAVRRAILSFEYYDRSGRLGSIGSDLPPSVIRLGLDDGGDQKLVTPTADPSPKAAPPPPTVGRYELRVRRERGVATGLFGADAVTDARTRPMAADFARKQVQDMDFILTPNSPQAVPTYEQPLALTTEFRIETAEKLPAADTLKQFYRAIGVDRSGSTSFNEGPRGVRFAIRPQASPAQAPAAWCPVDIAILIDPAKSAVGRTSVAVAAPVEIFEHPVRVESPPLLFDDIGGEAGRVLVLHPSAGGKLKDFLANSELVQLRDGARRVATLVRWNGRPSLKQEDPTGVGDLARFFGGFDLFEIDAAGEAEAASSSAAAVAASYKIALTGTAAGAGKCVLSVASGEKQSAACELLVSRTDSFNRDRSADLDRLDQSPERVKGQLRLVHAADPSRWIAFDLIAAIKENDFYSLILTATDASSDTPFEAGNMVKLLFTRIPARHIARVQALPAAIGRLDPSEISDFSKVEAHYPSETWRLQNRRSGRRAPWYSPAESFVLWPQLTLRRGLSINVDEPALTELLSNGRPTHVEATLMVGQIQYDVRDLEHMPSPFRPKGATGGAIWTSASLRALMQSLTWDQSTGKTTDAGSGTLVQNNMSANQHFASRPDDFRAARLTLTARRAATMLASVELTVDLAPALHPVLADTIDRLRYGHLPDSSAPQQAPGAPAQTSSVYRRYEPVIEPPPQSSVTDVAGWFDDTPTERDPYGWNILRGIGLATGLRLYDTETRDYVEPKDALKLLEEAFSQTLKCYADLHLGAPVVDVITRAGGTMRLASFDGGTSGFNEQKVEELLNKDVLAMMQLSLRPVVNRWANKADKTPVDMPVAYFAVKTTSVGQGDKLEISIPGALSPKSIIVADVLDLTFGLATPPLVTLASNVKPSETATKELRDALTGRPDDRDRLEIDISRARKGDIVALLRVTVTEGNAGSIAGNINLVNCELTSIGNPDDTDAGKGSPFGRFADMAPQRYGALAAVHEALGSANDELLRYARRRWPAGVPVDEAGKAELIARIPEWTRRFMDHAPAGKPDGEVYFALAEVTRPDPWRVALQDDGTMEVLLTHDDRKRRLKRYAVRPFGRYDNFVDALRAIDPAYTPRPPQLTGAWSDKLASSEDMQAEFERTVNRCLFDIVIPRTEPIAPPVLIDSRRVTFSSPGEGGGPVRERHFLEFLYRRHPEEILSEANITTEGALSFETVSVGFWREFPMQGWAKALVPAINTTAEFGSWDQRPAPVALIDGGDGFGGLALSDDGAPGRYVDGWQGAMALRTEALPFFFRIHSAAFASAGVVVSDPVVATVEEGHYELRGPWTLPEFGQAKPPSRFVPSPRPRWQIERVIDAAGAEIAIDVLFQLPLARFIDEMPLNSITTWLSGLEMPEVFTLPDPLARYEIRLLAKDSSGARAASPELDLISQQIQPPAPPVDAGVPTLAHPTASYRVNALGPLFLPDPADAPKPTPRRCDDQGVWWYVSVRARLSQNNRGPNPPAPEFSPPPDRLTPENLWAKFELHPMVLNAGAVWTQIAPLATVTVAVTPLINTDPASINLFKEQIGVWLASFQLYAADPAATEVINFLTAWMATDGTGGPPPLTIENVPTGLPLIPDGRNNTVTFTRESIGNWRSPADYGIASRLELSGLAVITHTADFPPERFADNVVAPLRREFQNIRIGQKQAEAGNQFRNFPPYCVPLGADLAASALSVGLAPPASPHLPAVADVMIAIPIDGPPAFETLIKLIKAVEATRFTGVTLADLGRFENGATTGLLHVPASALLVPDVAAGINAIGGGDRNHWRATSLLLRMPATVSEQGEILSAIQAAVTDANAAEALRKCVLTAIQAHVFGPDRQPGLKIFRGTASPVEADILLAGGEPWPCQ